MTRRITLAMVAVVAATLAIAGVMTFALTGLWFLIAGQVPLLEDEDHDPEGGGKREEIQYHRLDRKHDRAERTSEQNQGQDQNQNQDQIQIQFQNQTLTLILTLILISDPGRGLG